MVYLYTVYPTFPSFVSQDNQEPNGVVYQVRGSDRVLFRSAVSCYVSNVIFPLQELMRPNDTDPYQVLEPSKRKVSHLLLLTNTFKGHILTCSGT